MFLILKGDSNFILSPYFSNDRKGYSLKTKFISNCSDNYTLKAPRPPSEHRTDPER